MNELIYQTDPEFSILTKFQEKGWTDTVKGYVYEANKMVSCLLLNEDLSDRQSRWKVSINIEVEMSVTQIKQLWNSVSRKLVKQGIIALWIREPSLSNHCNYNLIVSGEMSRDELAEAIETAMPNRSETPWHKWIRSIKTRSQLHFCLRYFLKAEPKGIGCPDTIKYEIKRKRLLFRKHLGLRKCGQIGKFWVKSKKELWEDIKDRESQIGSATKEVKELAQEVAKVLCINTKEVERNFCFRAETPVIQQWAEQWKEQKSQENGEPQFSLLG
jgi:hypothetical protein